MPKGSGWWYLSQEEDVRYGTRINMSLVPFWPEWLTSELALTWPLLVLVAVYNFTLRRLFAKLFLTAYEWKCSHCGTFLDAMASHCPFCGMPLRKRLV